MTSELRLSIVGAGHTPDHRVNVSALAFHFLRIQAPPRNTIVADAHDEDATLLKGRAIRFVPVQ